MAGLENTTNDDSRPEPPPSAAAAAVVVGVANALFIVVAMGREVLLARQFGLSVLGDAWAIASALPELFQNFLTAGLIANAAIPLLSRRAQAGDAQTGPGAARVALHRVMPVVLALLVLALVRLDWFIRPFAPGADAETLAAARQTALLLWPVMPLLLAGGFAAAMMQYRRRFWEPAFAPTIYTLPVVLALILCGDQWGTLAAAGAALISESTFATPLASDIL